MPRAKTTPMLILMLWLALLMTACRAPGGAAAQTAVPAPPASATATTEPVASPAPTLQKPTITPSPTVTASGPCLLTADADTTVYQRPDIEAGIFGTLAAGDTITPTLVSPSGWLGFQPAVAQAANVGVFRYRWVAPDAPVTTGGACAALPVGPEVSPTACYFMAMSEAPLHSAPGERAPLVTTLPAGSWAAVSGISTDGWYLLALQDSSQPQSLEAWLAPELGNFNGPCGDLPRRP